jgi:hypothetical protein
VNAALKISSEFTAFCHQIGCIRKHLLQPQILNGGITMKHHPSPAAHNSAGARIYYVERRCVGSRSAHELVTALIQVHRR